LTGITGRTLEVGCGSGHFSALLAEKGYQAFLLDYSFRAVLCARNSFLGYKGRKQKRYVVGNAFSLPFEEATFDAVLSCGLLEHFEDWNPVVAEMARVLKDGGLFYADICPRKASLINMISGLHYKKKGWYEAKISDQEIIQMTECAGLTIKRFYAGGVLPPRDLPGKGRIRMLNRLERMVIERFPRFWRSFDGTRIGELFGFYYYVTAIK
jgi:ubiquinone/menaquinone biosynthesis C-methylase UbiE